ncbi:hypothetical protein [Dyella telluris]|uniref:Uncharacterized protein n=1 Tax=Dyella telluris TaxID=2763498 RepID=A0A7G8Q618_9GAMM|nr:hypothetical protein [Dyella telluris]QNK02226.1 hypothetical protein H8F01_03420 [Dyella telluris]
MTMVLRTARLLALAPLAMMAWIRPVLADDAARDLPEGTYELLICSEACSIDAPEKALISGRMVLLPYTFSRAERELLDPRDDIVASQRDLSACYTLSLLPGRKFTGYANTRHPAVTGWSYQNQRVHLSLFRSPDAGYEVDMSLSDSLYTGTGMSWGAGAADPNDPHIDYVLARRTGPADISQCGLPASSSR